MEVEIIRTETIKPSSPTPLDLKIYSLSIFDLLSPTTCMPILMFYPSNDSDISVARQRSDKLKKSLSETLTRFYIFAGRIQGFASIHCNDEGADFIEARTNSLLSDVLNPPNPELLKIFLPDENDTECLLRVQATFFGCGGMTIGLRLSHKISDASSNTVFLKSWSDAALGTRISEPPFFIDASVLPPVDFPVTTASVELSSTRKCATTRLVFDASKIVELKRKCVSENVKQPSRVEAVTALIWRCAMSSRSNSSLRKPSILCHALNLRKHINPPLPNDSIGNLGSFFTAQSIDNDIALHVLIEKLRNGVKYFTEYGVKKLQENGFSAVYDGAREFSAMWTRDDLDIYICSSCCKFDMYIGDFGWGKPVWVSLANSIASNTVVMMDTRDGEGIEAWLTLSDEEMVAFERNEELLAFASLNPSILTSPFDSRATRISSRM